MLMFWKVKMVFDFVLWATFIHGDKFGWAWLMLSAVAIDMFFVDEYLPKRRRAR